MRIFVRKTVLSLTLCLMVLLSGCGASADDEASPGESTDTAGTAVVDPDGLFSDRDLAGTYDESTAVSIELNGETASCSSDAVTVDGGRVTITDAGTFLLSGTLTEGQIVINAGDTDKVQMVLAGADITSAASAAIYALEADKVFVTLAEGTENTLTNGGTYEAIDDNNIDAVIFAKTDLTLNGSGSLTIQAQAGHGVVSKDDLVVAGGNYTITAASTGLTGKDSLSIADGSFAITSGKDGLHAENADDAALGCLYIAGGSYTIRAQGDAVSASGALRVDGGTFDLTTGEGSASVTMDTGESFDPGQRGAPGQAPAAPEEPAQTEEAETDSVSEKGLKADGSITVNGGSFTADTADDSIHANGDILITAGTFTLRSGDDALHSDGAVTIQNGTFDIPYCYEGIEGLTVTIDGGDFTITSQDDGINAAGGADSSGFGGGRPQQDQFSASSDSWIVINGGTFTIVSQGDCIDSNEALTINGGTLDLTCNGNRDTALDADGTYTNNGGEVTTNDGSEENPGAMTGGRGGGQMGDGHGPSEMPRQEDGPQGRIPGEAETALS